MFVQVILGHVDDPAGLQAAVDRWVGDLAPAALGWLGSTTGVASDGTALTLVRFETEAAARANSDRPEQAAWWRETEPLFTGAVEFHDCRTVLTLLEGGSDEAGFVQVREGRVTNPDRAQAVMAQREDALRSDRPEILGSLVAFHDDDQTRFTQAVYFTSEAAAREGERREPSREGAQLRESERALLADLTYVDLDRPWMHSPS